MTVNKAWLGILMLLFIICETASAEDIVTQMLVQRAPTVPVIDGRLDDLCWKKAAPISGFRLSDQADEKALSQTIVRVLYDDRHIYLGIEVMNPNMAEIAAMKCPGKQREEDVISIDTVEWYLCMGDMTDYYWMGMNVLGLKGDAHWGGSEDQPFDWNGKWTGKVTQASDRWVIEAAMPFSDVSESVPEAGDMWLTNFARMKIYGNTKENSALNVKYSGFHYPGIKLCFK